MFGKHVMNNLVEFSDIYSFFPGIKVENTLEKEVDKPYRSSDLTMNKGTALQLYLTRSMM